MLEHSEPFFNSALCLFEMIDSFNWLAIKRNCLCFLALFSADDRRFGLCHIHFFELASATK